ncbi:restriction endonuclease subunit S [Facklamia sp. P12934]|uniref:restriction endonuclease subunit S n=1 Tax=Facklamia sp. P12934 TaxID=3421948 RepID=UPI003D169E54
MGYKLKDLAKKIASGATPKGGANVYELAGISFIRSQNILDFEFNDEGLAFINENQADKLSNVAIEGDDILLNITGDSVARCCVVPSKLLPARVNQHVMLIRINKERVNPDYIFYYLQYIKKNLLQLSSGGATRKALTKEMIENIEIRLPQRSQQDETSRVLNTISLKILNNNAIISNLEAQAQAIFKSWFIDFEPFQDGEFVDSELGEIPKGWDVKKLGNFFKFVKGKKPKKIVSESQVSYMPYLVKKYIDGVEESYANPEHGIKINELNVFMLMDGANSGNIYYGYEGVLGSTFSLLEVLDSFSEEYIYWYLKKYELDIKSQNTGSAIPHANKDYIQSIKVPVPRDFNSLSIISFLKNIRLKSINLRKQNVKLSEWRDILLPKLMSGEIRVGQDNLEEIED